VLAINQKIALARVNGSDFTMDDIVMFPEFHKDTIREIAVSEVGNKNLVISGGFDGNVFVTDITRLCSDIQKNQKKSENSLYPCRDVVGSVSWHPEDSYLASATTDTGTLHIFDIRTDRRRPAIVYDTAKRELFTHAYRDGGINSEILLGFGDGQIQVFDVRNKRSMMSFQDPCQRQIGEIQFDYITKHFLVFGSPEFTLWNYDQERVNLSSHHQMAEAGAIHGTGGNYKTSGDFRKGTCTFGTTDSCGTFSLYSYRNGE